MMKNKARDILIKDAEVLLGDIQINNKRGSDVSWRYEEERDEAEKHAKVLLRLLKESQPSFEGRESYILQGYIDRIDDDFRKLKLGVYNGHSFYEFSLGSESTCDDFYRMLKRPPMKVVGAPKAETATYVAKSRIDELTGLSSDNWDYGKLIELCRELNVAYANSCVYSAGMLVRAILDHVPPVFGVVNFEQVIANYGSKSFKGSMRHLNALSRDISNGFLHSQIRQSESLPNPQQVEFLGLIDALLSEIVRIEKKKD